jgi:hypothetical protein
MDTGPTSFGDIRQSEVMAGDEIHAAFGCNVPIILRPLRTKVAASTQSYEFIGTCYLHGIMDGEALEKSPGGDEILLSQLCIAQAAIVCGCDGCMVPRRSGSDLKASGKRIEGLQDRKKRRIGIFTTDYGVKNHCFKREICRLVR